MVSTEIDSSEGKPTCYSGDRWGKPFHYHDTDPRDGPAFTERHLPPPERGIMGDNDYFHHPVRRR